MLVAALWLAAPVRAEPSGVPTPPDPQLAAIDRDDAAAEGALAKGDVEATLRYFDYFGHEQEDFARATLEYRLARQKLGDAVRELLGRRAWGRAARALGVPRHWRGDGGEPRTVRREGNVVYLKAAGGATLRTRDDRSIVAEGENPERDTYTIHAPAGLDAITALRLEALPDDTLKGNGPGRSVTALSAL